MRVNVEQVIADKARMEQFICQRIPAERTTRIELAQAVWADLFATWDDYIVGWDLQIVLIALRNEATFAL